MWHTAGFEPPEQVRSDCKVTVLGKLVAFAPSNIPFLALGAWILTVGWFGFNVMSAQTMDGISGLVAVNSLMAMVGGIIVSLLVGKMTLALFITAH